MDALRCPPSTSVPGRPNGEQHRNAPTGGSSQSSIAESGALDRPRTHAPCSMTICSRACSSSSRRTDPHQIACRELPTFYDAVALDMINQYFDRFTVPEPPNPAEEHDTIGPISFYRTNMTMTSVEVTLTPPMMPLAHLWHQLAQTAHGLLAVVVVTTSLLQPQIGSWKLRGCQLEGHPPITTRSFLNASLGSDNDLSRIRGDVFGVDPNDIKNHMDMRLPDVVRLEFYDVKATMTLNYWAKARQSSPQPPSLWGAVELTASERTP